MIENIFTPADLRQLSKTDLPQLAEEVRALIIQNTAHTGGHLASNLGTVELAIALHYVFNTPEDRLIWDVGHQAYAHKILTGRREKMHTLRQKGGLSGFPKRSESEFDCFGVGHSSTSISAALGMARAARLENIKRLIVAVIGDGALSAGMAFEAMNNVKAEDENLLVVLNDNEMSISKPVGALSSVLTRITSGKTFNAARQMGKHVLQRTPSLLEWAKRTEEHLKGMITPGTLFEELGFHYFGPIDGHDLPLLIQTLDNLKNTSGPNFLHVVTQKGKGYAPAEEEPTRYHGVSSFNVEEGLEENAPQQETFTDVFGAWIVQKAQEEERLIAITPAMCEGSGLVEFRKAFPQRYFDVGIAEQHALTFAAGLACDGMRPVVAIYSTFLQRAYDQLIHDIALQNLPVLLAVDRAGIVGADGPTHHGQLDLSFSLCVPNLHIFAPADKADLIHWLNVAYALKKPALVRYPRGNAPVFHGEPFQNFKTHAVLKEGRSGVALLVFGPLLFEAIEAVEELDVTLINMRQIKPLDADFLKNLANTHSRWVTLEDNAVLGGAGVFVGQFLRQNALAVQLEILGLPDVFLEHGTQKELFADCQLNALHLKKHLQKYF